MCGTWQVTQPSSTSTTNPDDPPPPPEAEDAAVMKERVEKFGMWVQQALPVLLEIVRKGGRYSESSVSGLRLSFQEAIDSARVFWHTDQVPPNFDEFIEARCSQFSDVKWVHDNSSDHCLLCVDKFSYSNRRHHCRACGILCCAACSSKRMTLKPQNVKSSSSKGPITGERVCDGCYNRLIFQAIQRNAAVAKAKKDLAIQQKKEQEELEKSSKFESNKANLFGSAGDSNESSEKDGWTIVQSTSNSSLDSSGAPVKKSTSNSDIIGLQNTLGDVNANFAERGEKLNTLAQKSEALDNVSIFLLMLLSF